MLTIYGIDAGSVFEIGRNGIKSSACCNSGKVTDRLEGQKCMIPQIDPRFQL